MRITKRLAITLLFIFVSSTFGQSVDDTAFNDTALNDVTFVGLDHGWAVGDHGKIVHTSDGGKNWQLQSSSVRHRLESVCFVNAEVGWAVGGYAVPYTHRSSAILLTTQDAGKTWKTLDSRMLPWLTRVKFFDAKRGFAIGQRSGLYPTGVFTTKDGGQSWLPIQGKLAADCRWAELDVRRSGQLVDDGGRFYQVKNGRIKSEPQQMKSIVHQFNLMDGKNGLACGDDGSIFVKLPYEDRWFAHRTSFDQFRFTQIESISKSHWLAGSPGTTIFRSEDDGRTWQQFPTGQDLPINGMTFLDSKLGYAVGPFGLILNTINGGQSWQVQRGGKRRAAIMAVYSNTQEIPWQWLADACAFDGFRSVLVLVDESTPGKLGKVDSQRRAAESFRQVGGCQVVVFRPNSDTSVNQADQLIPFLTKQIQTWKPNLVVTGNESLAATLQKARQVAANDQNAPWSNAHIALSRIAPSDQAVQSDQLVIASGQWTSELVDRVRYQFPNQFNLNRKTKTTFSIIRDEQPAAQIEDVRSLLGTSVNGLSNRRPRGRVTKTLHQQQQQAQRRRNVRVMIGEKQIAKRFDINQLNELAQEIDPFYQAEIYYRLAQRAMTRGDYAMAQSLFHKIVFAHVYHPLSEAAAIELSKLLSSEEHELAKSKQDNQIARVSAVVQLQAENASQVDSVDQQRQEDRLPISQTQRIDPTQLARQIQERKPSLFFDNGLRFARSALDRRSGQLEKSIGFYKSQLTSQSDPAWRSIASTELALVDRTKTRMIIKPSIPCQTTIKPPFLDGNLDDRMWQDIKPIRIKNAENESEPRALIWIGYDHRFLYIAAACKKSSDLKYEVNQQTRKRDADLSNQDRIEIAIDVDRDYATFWKLTVDSRGWGSESIGGNETWNPVWYIAPGMHQDAWFFEAAIPLDQLTKNKTVADQAWNFNVRRKVADKSSHAWVGSDDAPFSATNFGLLRFFSVPAASTISEE